MEPIPPTQPISKEVLKTKLRLAFHFGPHATEDDARALRPQLEKCDIFIPEMYGWSQRTKQIYNDVSLGKTDLFDAVEQVGGNYPQYKLNVFEELHGTNKAVAFADIPSGHPSLEEEKKLDDQEEIVNTDFVTATKKKMETAKAKAAFISQREGYMVDNLPKIVAEILANNPELAAKSNVNVFLQLGSTHTRVSHFLQKEGYVIGVREFPEKEYSFGGYGHELTRRILFNKPVSEELLARSVIEDLFLVYFGRNYNFLVDQLLDVYTLSRAITSKIPQENLQTCWDEMRGITVGYQYAFERILEKQGITLPKNSSEVEAIVHPKK